MAPTAVIDASGGALAFGEGELDAWARHLAWCYRLLGVDAGETIALQDFGSSPLSFLSSTQLTPTLEAGVDELLGVRTVYLDASQERLALTGAVLEQARPDVLVVRADVTGALHGVLAYQGLDLRSGPPPRVVVATEDGWPPLPAPHWRRLLCAERSLLLAPECSACGCFHICEALYELAGQEVRNLLMPTLEPHPLRLAEPARRGCPAGERDWLVRLSEPRPE